MTIIPSEFEILVVDDIPSNVLLMKAILTREKYRVATAPGGKEAISIIENNPPDLVLLDIMMPGMDGFQVCQYIRKNLNLSDLPIIMLTALNSTEDVVKGFAVEANDFVSKPFNNDVLLMRIKFQLSVVESTRIIKRQSDELAKTISSRDTLYSVIAHDLRSPLATIKMVMNYVVDKVKDYTVDEDFAEMLQTVNSIAEDSFTLFDNLLKWTKSQTGRLNLIPQKVEVSELVESSIEIHDKLAASKGIKIVVLMPDHKVEIETDIDMMKTVFRNLLSNAIKFSTEGNSITVSADDEPEKVVFSVTDQGTGISQENIDKIINGKVDFTTKGTNSESGSGLGLLLTKEFINRNGGELSVQSVIGEGSTFSFYIPKSK